jgi:hypothetical protein
MAAVLSGVLSKRAVSGTTVATIVNTGYTEMALNLVHSMAMVGLDVHLVVFCLQPEACAIIREHAPTVAAVDISETGALASSSNFTEFYGKSDIGFAQVTAAKLHVAQAVLAEGYDLLFTDSDVIWKRGDIIQHVQEFVHAR